VKWGKENEEERAEKSGQENGHAHSMTSMFTIAITVTVAVTAVIRETRRAMIVTLRGKGGEKKEAEQKYEKNESERTMSKANIYQ
jgi:hypothetical protein